MRVRRTPARGLGLLFLLCLLLAGAVAMETRYPDALVMQVWTSGDGTPTQPGPAVAPTSEDGAYRPPGETAFRVIEERPLFAPTRRPPEVGSEPVEKGPPPPSGLDGLALTGIIRAGEEWVAIVEPAGPPRPGNEALSLGAGDTLRGWTVESILEDRMVLIHGTQRFEMELTDDPARRRRGQRRPPASGGLRTPGVFAPQPQRTPQPAPQPAPQPRTAPQPQSNR
jgi:hypothetical protein